MQRCLLLVLLLAAWHVDVEALPLQSAGAEHGAHHLGEAAAQDPADAPIVRPEVQVAEVEDASQTPQMAGQKVRVQNSMDKVKEALAEVNGGSPAASSVGSTTSAATASDSFPSASGFVDSQESTNPTQVALPRILDPNELVHHEEDFVKNKPPPPEFINRDLRPGHPRYIIQNSEDAILTADHALHKIYLRLQMNRDHLYNVARGAKNELVAAQQGSHATADMANAVRLQQETDMATVEKTIQNIKSQMVDVRGVDNKEHAKLQLQLERAKRKHAELLAQAKTMGEAVDQAITKAGEIEGRARANYHASMDPNMELEHAIIEAAKAKMALAQHDQEVALQNNQQQSDKKKEIFFDKVEEKGQEAMDKIKEQFDEQSTRAEEEDYQKEIAQAKQVEQAAASVGTIPAPAMVDPATVAAAAAGSAVGSAVSPEVASASAQSAIQTAHESGRPEDAEEAMAAIAQQQAAGSAQAAQSVAQTVEKSAEIAKEAAAEVETPSAASQPSAEDQAAEEAQTADAAEETTEETTAEAAASEEAADPDAVAQAVDDAGATPAAQ